MLHIKKIANAKMIKRIAKCTNKEGQRVRGEQWRHTDATEIEGFIGCLLHMGVLRDNGTPTTILWSKTEGNPLVMACFSRDRFIKLSNHVRFDGKETRSQRREKDAFAPLRDLWEDFEGNLSREYVPGPTLTVDEQLMPWRGRCAFLQYLPLKPDKYGIKIFWICDSENGFPLHGDLYLGRNGQKRETNIGRNTAIALASPYFGIGRNLTVGNFFTDMELSAHLLANNMTLVETVRRNKRFLPQEFQTGQGLKKGDAIFGFQKIKPQLLRINQIKKACCCFEHDASR